MTRISIPKSTENFEIPYLATYAQKQHTVRIWGFQRKIKNILPIRIQLKILG